MRTLITLFVLLLVPSSSNAEIISLAYWHEHDRYAYTLSISDTSNGLKLMRLGDQETPFSFNANPRHRDVEGYWNNESDFYFRFRPVWHRHNWDTEGLGIATPELLLLQNNGVYGGRPTPSRVAAGRFVPEPSGLILVALGAVLMPVRVRRV